MTGQCTAVRDESAAKEIGAFLRARRARLTPAEVGLTVTAGGLRRTPGLRREEVAGLATISTDYYARIEQGRRVPPPETLALVADALRLEPVERAYLAELADHQTGRPAAHPSRPASAAAPQLARMLALVDDSPALVLDRAMQVLAWNDLSAALYLDFATIDAARRNYLWLMFTDLRLRRLHIEWAEAAAECVAHVRPFAGGDPTIARLAAELAARDRDFATWWAEHPVARRATGVKRLLHPRVGALELRWDALSSQTHPEQQLVVLTAPDGSASADAISRLTLGAGDG